MGSHPHYVFSYLSANEAFLVDHLGKEHQVKSYFAEETEQKAQQSLSRHSWKNEDEFGAFDAWGSSKYSHWGQHRVRFTSLSKANKQGFIFYLLQLPDVVGLFRYELSDGDEYRAFHKNEIAIADICHHPHEERLVAVLGDRENAHVAILSNSTFDYELLTEGDVFDSAPSWDLSNEGVVFYHSCGVGRNQGGDAIGFSPSSICSIQVEEGDLRIVKEDDAYDYLTPKTDAEGNLYFIRRPYQVAGLRKPLHMSIWDGICVPFRFVKGVFTIVDSLSKVLSKKPLVPDGPKRKDREQDRWINLKGVNIDLHTKDHGKDKDGGIVPKSWCLIRMAAEGEEEVVAKGVLDFDVTANGRLLYSNGYQVKVIDDAGEELKLESKSIIEEVRWLASE